MATAHERRPLRRLSLISNRHCSSRVLLIFLALPLLYGGCASPGEPVERKAPVPQAVADLAAAQSGNDVTLTFTVPRNGVNRLPLKTTPSVEIYRGTPNLPAPQQPAGGAAASASNANLTLLATIPAAMIGHYAQHGQVRYADSLAASDYRALAGGKVEYVVRAYIAPGKISDDSNAAVIGIVVPPAQIEDLAGEVTHSGISLHWTPPSTDMAGNPAAIHSYRVYRREVTNATQTPAPPSGPGPSPAITPADESGQFARVAEVDAPAATFLDTGAAAGATYAYSVRSTLDRSGEMVESADSNVVTVVDKDTFPPAAPQNVVIAPVPAQAGVPAHLEISWQISPEPDVAGYNVYRSDDPAARGQLQNTELLPTPAFRDMKVAPGRRYFYTVTAVDRSGNESAPSVAASGDVPAENPGP